MPAVHQSGLMSVFTINAASQLALAKNATITLEEDTEDYASIVSAYPGMQGVQRGGRLSAELLTANTLPVKTSTLNISAFSLGGTSHLATLEEGELSVEWEHKEGNGGNDEWKFPIGVGKNISISATILVPTAGLALPALMGGALSGLSITTILNLGNLITASASLEFPTILKSCEHVMAYRDVQKLRVQLEPVSNYPTAGFPTAPTGFTTLLEKAINGNSASDPWPALAFALTSKATTGGAAYSGNMLLSSLRVPFGRGRALAMQTEWATQGAVTITSPN